MKSIRSRKRSMKDPAGAKFEPVGVKASEKIIGESFPSFVSLLVRVPSLSMVGSTSVIVGQFFGGILKSYSAAFGETQDIVQALQVLSFFVRCTSGFLFVM